MHAYELRRAVHASRPVEKSAASSFIRLIKGLHFVLVVYIHNCSDFDQKETEK